MKFYEVSLCQISYLVIHDTPGVSIRVLVHFQDHFFLMISDGFLEFRVYFGFHKRPNAHGAKLLPPVTTDVAASLPKGPGSFSITLFLFMISHGFLTFRVRSRVPVSFCHPDSRSLVSTVRPGESTLRHPPVSGPGPSEIQISKIKLYRNEEFSIATLMICNVDSNCVHIRFQIRVHMWARVNISDEILEILRISTSWNQIL